MLNNFPQDHNALKLMTKVFQNMFPAINVATVALKEIRRVLLLHYDPATERISLRHYEINARPVGMSKAVKQLVTSSIPDLSKFNDVSDFILRSADGYESEGDTDAKVRAAFRVPGRVRLAVL